MVAGNEAETADKAIKLYYEMQYHLPDDQKMKNHLQKFCRWFPEMWISKELKPV